MQQAQMYKSPAYDTRQQNTAVAAAKMANSGTALAGVGMQPGANFLAASQSAANSSGAAAGLARVAGSQVAKDKSYGAGMDIIKLGRNQTATSASLNSQLASTQAGLQAAQFQAAQNEKAQLAGALGTAAGMAGMAGYKKWGPTDNQYLNNNQNGNVFGNVWWPS